MLEVVGVNAALRKSQNDDIGWIYQHAKAGPQIPNPQTKSHPQLTSYKPLQPVSLEIRVSCFFAA
jgi:hypothetical protein